MIPVYTYKQAEVISIGTGDIESDKDWPQVIRTKHQQID